MKPVTLETAIANGYGYALTLPYLEHEGWMLANAINSLRRSGKEYALVREVHSSNHGQEGIAIYLKGGLS